MPVAVTLGDPWGIGPEVTARAIVADAIRPGQVLVLGPRFAWESMCSLEPGLLAHRDYFLEIATDLHPGAPGKPPTLGGQVVLDTLHRAVDLVNTGDADALVTAPLNKSLIHKIDPAFVGHTEFFGQAFGIEDPTMTFVGPEYVTALVTTHVSLRKLADEITEGRVYRHIMRLWEWLRSHRGDAALLAVTGLNPHAGEAGAFGDEEIRVIGPAIERARSAGARVDGPFPADTVYRVAGPGGRYAGVLAMYHDQALVLFKTTDGNQGVNMTLGLPVVRTSPDHGTAYNIAGKGIADFRSMQAALNLVLP